MDVNIRPATIDDSPNMINVRKKASLPMYVGNGITPFDIESNNDESKVSKLGSELRVGIMRWLSQVEKTSNIINAWVFFLKELKTGF